jgi:phosphate transport system substrate-binding protein
MRIALLACCLLLPLAANARDQIRVVGSSTVFPYVAAAAEQFGRETEFRTPIVEATGTGGGIKLFCEGIGDAYPDMANASRRIKDSEIEQCAKHGIKDIMELKIGYDGIVLANARQSQNFKLSKRALFLALAREVPKDGKLVTNFYKNWRDIDPALPNIAISVYGPPPTSGTRDAFVELVMDEACKGFDEFKAKYKDEKLRKKQCSAMREDGVFVEAGEDDNLIVQKLTGNPDALGLFGYSFLEENVAKIKANPVDGVMPSFDNIVNGDYRVARSLYVYVKLDHVKFIPGIKAFALELTADSTSGEDGYLIMKGLLPLPKNEHDAMKKTAASLIPMQDR